MTDLTPKYWSILGVAPGSSPQEIKKAFKELAFKYHPDRNPKNAWAEERFKEALEAYSFLSGNMEAYRAMTSKAAAATVAADPGADILKVLFDIDAAPAARHKQPLSFLLALSMEEAFAGTEKRISVTRDELCKVCKGRGVDEGARVFTCTYCFGSGAVGGFGQDDDMECPKCNGRGILSSQGCTACRARGFVSRGAKVRVEVPPGVRHGQKISIPGEGHQRNAAARGELVIEISLTRHPVFSFDGKDIICESSVDMTDAALGGEISVPTLRGATRLMIPPGTQSGQVFRLKGLGLGGDQFVKIQVKTPVALSEKERNSLLSLKRAGAQGKPSFLKRLKRWFW